jgi:two-component system, OmpR family, osmolarity sensor histidine kinase EnvZ
VNPVKTPVQWARSELGMLERGTKRILPHGLLGRSLLILVTPLIVVQLVSAYVFYASHWEVVTKRLVEGLVGDISALIEGMREIPDADSRARLLTAQAARMGIEVRFEPNGILPNHPRPKPSGILATALYRSLDERLHRPFQVDFDHYPRQIALRIQLSEGLFDVLVPKKRLFSYTTTVFLLWMVGTAMLFLGIAMVFMRNQVRSVRRLAAAADRFGRGLEVRDFKPEGATEVRQAAQAFNLMRERILRQIQQRTEMLAGVSHDLRTPLTRMKLQLAMMDTTEGVEDLAQDVTEMERMVEGYLAFARGEGGEKPEAGDLAALVEEVVGRYRRQGREIDLHSEGAIAMSFRPQAMARALGNLIGNALRHATLVRVRVGRRKQGVEVTIDDDGPGIPAARREEVFKPFTRLDPSRNPQSGGVGLGLTIARDVVRGHGGDILLEDSPQGGLRVRLRLPL